MNHDVVSELKLDGPLPEASLAVEASAGTGKTYSVTALVVRHVAERAVPMSAVLIVTFTRAAAAELRDRTRRALVAARDACDTGIVPDDHPWMHVLTVDDGQRQVRHHRLAAAVATFDEATISTIHGFCQQALVQLGVRSGQHTDAQLSDGSLSDLVEEVCLDLALARLSHDPHALSWTNSSGKVSPSTVVDTLCAAVSEVLRNPLAERLPTREQRGHLAPPVPEWADLVDEAVDLVRRRRAERLELGYDDLILGLRHALVEADDKDDNCRLLAQRFQLVVVDESQDNDPLQWDIFEAAFGERMITVGDPKQAIYRFRGADVHSYLRQPPSRPRAQLSTNHRSDPDLVAATNLLLTDVRLGHERIVAHPVKAVEGRAPTALTPGPALDIRRVPAHPDIVNNNGTLTVEAALEAVLADLTRVVDGLLTDPGTLTDDDGPRAPHAGDIAVLVRSGTNADTVVRALVAAGIPAVRTRTGSVFDTEAVREWRTFLHALARPDDISRVSAAGLGVFLEEPPASLDTTARAAVRPDSPGDSTGDRIQPIVRLQQRCGAWSARLGSSHWLAWYDRVRSESGLVARLLQRPGGERMLTDIDHIAELLAADLGSTRPSAALALRRLDHLVAHRSKSGDEAGPEMRRIDSDSHAVKVSTIHMSKGLEYPIVLLPDLWTGNMKSKITVVNDETGRRLVDVATPFGWSVDDGGTGDLDHREHLDGVASSGDRLRVLYVALTRARHRTVVWWTPASSGVKSALSAVLFNRDDALSPLETSLGTDMTPTRFVGADLPAIDAEAHRVLTALAAASEDRLGVTIVDPTLKPALRQPITDTDTPPSLDVAPKRSIDEPWWKRWSFTSIAHRSDLSTADPAADSSLDTPLMGGVDEPSTVAGDADPSAAATPSPSVVIAPGTTVPAHADMPWSDIGGGKDFGTVVHDILELVDPQSLDLTGDLHRLIHRRLARSGLDLDPSVVFAGVDAAMRTPLGLLLDDLRLVDIGTGDRLAEMRFDLPLAGTVETFPASLIGEVLLATLDADDPMRDYAADIAAGRFAQHLAGYLQGSIDAVLRVGTPSAPRFVVVDYKTNKLHERDAADPMAAYHPTRLPEAMAHSDYPLQALLYSVALHRYLRWRLVDYDPDRHLGGIAYLYMRGMIGPDTPRHDGCPYGVFAWRPPASAITGLDHLLATGAVS